jgi:hypothetical protein
MGECSAKKAILRIGIIPTKAWQPLELRRLILGGLRNADETPLRADDIAGARRMYWRIRNQVNTLFIRDPG